MRQIHKKSAHSLRNNLIPCIQLSPLDPTCSFTFVFPLFPHKITPISISSKYTCKKVTSNVHFHRIHFFPFFIFLINFCHAKKSHLKGKKLNHIKAARACTYTESWGYTQYSQKPEGHFRYQRAKAILCKV